MPSEDSSDEGVLKLILTRSLDYFEFTLDRLCERVPRVGVAYRYYVSEEFVCGIA